MLVYLDLQLHREKAIYNGFSKNRISDEEVEHVVKTPCKIGDAGTHDLLQVCFIFARSQQKNRCDATRTCRSLGPHPFDLSFQEIRQPKPEGEYHSALVTGVALLPKLESA